MNIDRVIESVTNECFEDYRGNMIYVGDIVMIASGSTPIFGIVRKIYSNVGNFTVIPYDITTNKQIYDNWDKHRFYPWQAVNVNEMFKADVEKNKQIIKDVISTKQSMKIVYAYFKERQSELCGLCAFKVYSQQGKKFCKDDVVTGAKSIIENYNNEYELKFFTKDNTFIEYDDEVNYKNIFYNNLPKRVGIFNEYDFSDSKSTEKMIVYSRNMGDVNKKVFDTYRTPFNGSNNVFIKDSDLMWYNELKNDGHQDPPLYTVCFYNYNKSPEWSLYQAFLKLF